VHPAYAPRLRLQPGARWWDVAYQGRLNDVMKTIRRSR
jgi:hypothetical protein